MRLFGLPCKELHKPIETAHPAVFMHRSRGIVDDALVYDDDLGVLATLLEADRDAFPTLCARRIETPGVDELVRR
jgi:hypothetical protein